MARKKIAPSGVAPVRDRRLERILVAGGRRVLTLDALERACLARLARVVADAMLWPPEDFGDAWRIGDFTVLIVESTVGPGAELYVQFWSEPGQPVECEVSSGHVNRPTRRFITRRAKARLKALGFHLGGAARNFRKQVSVGNRGDAAAVAREVLGIFHDALGYRGATPLVVRVVERGRSGRAVVHDRFSGTDVVALLQRMGCEATLKKGRRVVIEARHEGFGFVVLPDVRAEGGGGFQCLDLVAAVGHAGDGAAAAWSAAINELNATSRVARGWIDDDGNVVLGTSFVLIGGLTEAYLAGAVAGWLRAATTLAADGPPKPRARKPKAPAGDDAAAGDRPRARAVVH